MIWSWPAKLPSNSKHSHVMSSLDLLPTFMAAAEADPLPLGPVIFTKTKTTAKRRSNNMVSTMVSTCFHNCGAKLLRRIVLCFGDFKARLPCSAAAIS